MSGALLKTVMLVATLALRAAGTAGGRGVAGAPDGELPLHLSTSRTTVGERVEVTVEAEQPGAELRFALAPQLDPALALTRRELLAPRDGRPGMRLQLVACAPGSIAVGPFALTLFDDAGRAHELTTATATVEVGAPWQSAEPPPFGAWRRAPPPSATSRWLWAIAAAALVAAGAWIAVRRRRLLRPGPILDSRPARPDLAAWRRRLLADPGEAIDARRSWCIEIHALVRAELAARASAAAFAWSREELVAGRGLGAWSAADDAEWTRLLAALERGMFARDSVAEPTKAIGAPLLALLERSAS